MSKTLPVRARVTICVALLLLGAAALWLIFSTEPEAQREAATRQTAMLVQVTSPEVGDFRPEIEAMGTVMPASEIVLTPRVSGEVVERSAAFVPGGFLRKGDVVIRIDDADYRNALAQRESGLQQAIAELEIEKGRQDLAERDYRELKGTISEDNRALILREPQLRASEAAVQSARAAVEQARLDLERTIVRAPYDAQVLTREVNVGSLVTAGDPLGRLAGVDEYWVETTLALDDLRWLNFSDEENRHGSPVHIRHRTAWAPGQVREGHLFRLIGELEGNTRLARALVTVPDPLARNLDPSTAPSLMIGTFVECRIEGQEIPGALRLRREHLRANGSVWLMRDGKLVIQPVEIVFEDAEFAYITGGLARDDQVVTTSLATVKEGVPLRTSETATP